MLTELELCEKRRHKADLHRRRRSVGPVRVGGHYGDCGEHPESWVQAAEDQAMRASLLTVLFRGIGSFFSPRRGR